MPWERNVRRDLHRLTAIEFDEVRADWHYGSRDAVGDDRFDNDDNLVCDGENNPHIRSKRSMQSFSLVDFCVRKGERKGETNRDAPREPLWHVAEKDDEVYRAIPRSGTDHSKGHEFEEKEEAAKKQLLDVTALTRLCNPQEFCGTWHESRLFVGCRYRVDWSKENRSFSLEICQGGHSRTLPVVHAVKEHGTTNNASILHKVMERTLGVTTASSLDRYDVFEQWIAYRQRHERSTAQAVVPSVSPSCIICFEDCSKNHIPSHCGHPVCIDCWQSYLDVTCRNAERICLPCPADKCSASVDLLEASFLVGNQVELWKRIVDTELERFASHDCRGFYCPNRYCSTLLVLESPISPATSPSEPSMRGSHVLVCHGCYEPICTDCQKPAHAGMTCKQATDIEKVLARMDEAALNLEFITKHTKPCPKCSYGITKVSGCNHMRCQHCQYYFCWMCGGFGNDCNAYQCFNPAEKDWWKNGDSDGFSGEIKSIENDADRYKSHLKDLSVYRSRERRMNVLQRMFNGVEETNDADDSVNSDALQVQYAIIMATSWKLQQQEASKYHKCKKIDQILEDLDSLAMEYWTRLGRKHKQLVRSPTRHLKKLKAAEAEKLKGQQDAFKAMARRQAQIDLSEMSPKLLREQSLKTMSVLMAFLLRTAKQGNPKTEHSRREREGRDLSVKEDEPSQMPPGTEPLNQRGERVHHGWKHKAEDTFDGEVQDKKRDVKSWKKTRERTNRQRLHDLGLDAYY